MITGLGNKNSLRDLILLSLQSGPLETNQLIQRVERARPKTTKQGIYKVLRTLRKEEIVIIHKKIVSLSALWVLRMSNYFSLAEHHYLKDTTSTGNFINLAEGEKIKYEFQNAVNTDTFWIHALHILIEAHPKQLWFGYNPHCWFFIARPESERALRDFIEEKGGLYIMTVGGKQPLDRYIIKEFNGKESKYSMRDKPLFQKNNYYVNIVGDFLVEVWIDVGVAKQIEKLYAETMLYTEEVKSKLEAIIRSRGRSRLVISRNHAKAVKLTRILSRPFVLPKIYLS